MKNVLRKAASIFLCLAVVLSFTPFVGGVTVYGAEDPVNIDTPDGFHYSNDYTIAGLGCDDGEVYLVGYDGDATDLVIPSTVEYQGATYTVTGIYEEALIYADDEYYAYWLDHDLTSLTLPDTLEYIASGAIVNLGITELTIPESVRLIESHAIGACPNLKTIRVLSSRTGRTDYYGDYCMGFYWDEDANAYKMNEDLVVWTVNTGNLSENESDIQSWCRDHHVTLKGFPPSKPRWSGKKMTWSPPAYRQDAVDYYDINVYRNGKPLSNHLTTKNLADPTACSYDMTGIFKSQGKGTYEFKVAAAVDGGYTSEYTGWSAEYVYTGPVNSWKLSFDASGGGGSMDPVSIDCGEYLILPQPAFTPPSSDKNFKCWKIGSDEYGIGQPVILRRDETAKAVWKDTGEPDWTYSIAVPDITVDTAHVGYTSRKVGSIRINNTGNQRLRGDFTVELTGDTDNAFTLYDGKPYSINAGASNTSCWVYGNVGMPPGTYTCNVTVTPPLPAQPVTANVSFTVTDHSYGGSWQSDTENHWKKCTECARPGTKEPHDTLGPITGYKAATFDEDGYTGDLTCSVCGAVSQEGKPTPAGKYITESSATTSPRYVQPGLSFGTWKDTIQAGDTKYEVTMTKGWDVTNDDRLIPANEIKATDTFETGHDYRFEVKFTAKGDYVYQDDGTNQHRWSTFTFNNMATDPAVMFGSDTIRFTQKIHCYSVPRTLSSTTEVILDQEYTGKEIKPGITLTIMDSGGEYELVEGVDYKVTGYYNNVELGTAEVILQGMGAFSGYKTATFNIVPKEVGIPDYEIKDRTYDGSAFVPDPWIKVDERTLVKGTDYTLTLKNSQGKVVQAATEVDWYEIDINFIGNYTRPTSYPIYFAIKPADISGATISGLKTGYPETGSAVEPKATVTLNGKTLTEGKDYTFSYTNNVEVGTATISVIGQGNYTGSADATFKIRPSVSKAKVTGVKDKTYTGKSLTQTPVVTVEGETLDKGIDYTVSYKSNKNVGKASVIITGIGNYSGTKTVTFKINPKGTTLKSLTAGSKSITVKWYKRATKMSTSYITGYQIQIATNSKFTKGVKKYTATKYRTVSKKLTKLKGKKKYYVRIRTYKTVGGVKYYSPWSKSKSVTTKK